MCLRRVMYGPNILKFSHWSRKKTLYGTPCDTPSGKQPCENIHENTNIRMRKIFFLLFEPCKNWETTWRLARNTRAASKLQEFEKETLLGPELARNARTTCCFKISSIRSTMADLVSWLHGITWTNQAHTHENQTSTQQCIKRQRNHARQNMDKWNMEAHTLEDC